MYITSEKYPRTAVALAMKLYYCWGDVTKQRTCANKPKCYEWRYGITTCLAFMWHVMMLRYHHTHPSKLPTCWPRNDASLAQQRNFSAEKEFTYDPAHVPTCLSSFGLSLSYSLNFKINIEQFRAIQLKINSPSLWVTNVHSPSRKLTLLTNSNSQSFCFGSPISAWISEVESSHEPTDAH
jgi:hypothetical protein